MRPWPTPAPWPPFMSIPRPVKPHRALPEPYLPVSDICGNKGGINAAPAASHRYPVGGAFMRPWPIPAPQPYASMRPWLTPAPWPYAFMRPWPIPAPQPYAFMRPWLTPAPQPPFISILRPVKPGAIAKEPGVLPIGRAIPGADALLFAPGFTGLPAPSRVARTPSSRIGYLWKPGRH